jgi:pyruvate dehydrogenase E2 component (dihydrolipoamide acetyltransferase)
MKTIMMPSFGADMAKGEVAQWLVKVGDRVKKGQIIASIETMKGLIDMEVFDDGVIEELLATEGTELEVGQPIAELRLVGEAMAEPEPEQQLEPVMIGQGEAEPEPVLPEQKQKLLSDFPIESDTQLANTLESNRKQAAAGLKISPAARSKAQKLGLDWGQLRQGHGPEGAIVLADIENLADDIAKQAMPSISAQEKLSPELSMRQAIARVVSLSKREIPHYYLQLDIVLDKAQSWLTEHNQSLPSDKRILLNALIYTAIARALLKFPDFNGVYQDGRFEAAKSVNLGNVINLHKGGLVVAAIHNAQQIAAAEMMEKLKDQVIRARDGGLRMSELQSATVTVSNLGERGCDSIQSIIFPPQVAIIGIGRQRSVPWIVNEKLTVASITSLTLAADHRVSDGHSGARLLNKINSLIQKPESLV